VDARVSAEGLSQLAEDGRAEATGRISNIRRSISEHLVLFGAEAEGEKGLDGRGRPGADQDVRKAGHSADEQKMLANVAVDAVFDSVSVATTFKKKLKEAGVIFCSFTEAVADYPELIQKYLGSVVPTGDNYYAALNSAVFSDGSFVLFRRASAARWSFRPISASTRRIPDSLNAR
jgi:Fe-S cluster assembly scaffold protein SufB